MTNYYAYLTSNKKTATFSFPLFIWVLFLFSASQLQAQTLLQWEKTLGGTDFDILRTVQPTVDGGFILGGYSQSATSGDKSATTKGLHDYWVVKVDALGNKLWDKTFGGSKEDFLQSVQQTLDGGFILGGFSQSPISGDKTQSPKGLYDYWIVKIDALGNKLWDKTLGGSKDDFLRAVQQTADGGYLLAGSSVSPLSATKTMESRGEFDFWIVKVDILGNKQWDKTFGGTEEDFLQAVQQTTDKGFLLAGYSYSPVSGEKAGASKGYGDYWIVKIDALGTKQWDKTLGGTLEDVLQSLQLTTDGGFMLAGTSDSPAGADKSENTKGDQDYWMIKVDASGNKQWDKTLGGNKKDELTSLQQTQDGGYLLGGTSASGISGNKTMASKGGQDAWFVKVDATGNLQWDDTVGGILDDAVQALLPLPNGYVVGGYSNSTDLASKGSYDFWLRRR